MFKFKGNSKKHEFLKEYLNISAFKQELIKERKHGVEIGRVPGSGGTHL